MKIRRAEGNRFHWWCPGCDEAHGVHTNDNGWTVNFGEHGVTINPSILVNGVQWKEGHSFYKNTHPTIKQGEKITCHSFVINDEIRFLSDCTHALAGTTVLLPEWPTDE